MNPKRPDVTVGLSLFGLSVQVSDVLSLLGKKSASAGPFAIVERASGQAVTASTDSVNGWQPWLSALDGNPQQRWMLDRTPHSGEVLIRSDVSGLVFDSTWTQDNEVPLILWEPHGEAHQRWRLLRTADNLAWYIVSVKDERVVDMKRIEDRDDGHPWMWDRHGKRWQQFLLLPLT